MRITPINNQRTNNRPAFGMANTSNKKQNISFGDSFIFNLSEKNINSRIIDKQLEIAVRKAKIKTNLLDETVQFLFHGNSVSIHTGKEAEQISKSSLGTFSDYLKAIRKELSLIPEKNKFLIIKENDEDIAKIINDKIIPSIVK